MSPETMVPGLRRRLRGRLGATIVDKIGALIK